MTAKASIRLIQMDEPRQPPGKGFGRHWQHFTSMPHHALFALGALQAVLVMLWWWLIDLGGRYGDWYAPIEWALPSPWIHPYLMIYGLFPLYMFGFLMTTYPKWMAAPPVARIHALATAALLGGAALLVYVGLAAGNPWLLLALGLHLAGWAMGLYALLRIYVVAQRPDTLHALVTSGVLLLGWGLLLTYTLGVEAGNADWVVIAASGGVWWFLLPVFFSVSHRLIPFFSNMVLPGYRLVRPDWTLWLMTAGGLAHGALEICGLVQWTWLVDLPMAATAIWLSLVWRLRKTLNVRILAMLHIAFAWLGIALTLYGLQSLGLPLGRAPLHALTVGYFASMLVAMSTRVTLGHSGRPLTADNLAWGIFLMVQAAALLRVAANYPAVNAYATHLYLCSAFIWLAAFAAWLIKFTPIYWRNT